MTEPDPHSQLHNNSRRSRCTATTGPRTGASGAASRPPRRPDQQVLIAYRYQPNHEKRHHQLKSVQDAAPITLKSPARIEALFACCSVALLCCCLIERELRNAMTNQQTPELLLYPEDRSSTASTATRIFEHLATLQRHHLT